MNGLKGISVVTNKTIPCECELTGFHCVFRENNPIGIRESRENDKIDSKNEFDRIKDTQERTGYLINIHSTEILDEDRRLVAALDLFFIQMDGSRFKASVVYEPYFLVLPQPEQPLEVARYLQKKYTSQLTRIEHIKKEDLDIANHSVNSNIF